MSSFKLPTLLKDKIDLTLAGNTLGGEIKIPFYKGTIAEALGQVKQQEKVKLHTFTCSKNKD